MVRDVEREVATSRVVSTALQADGGKLDSLKNTLAYRGGGARDTVTRTRFATDPHDAHQDF